MLLSVGSTAERRLGL